MEKLLTIMFGINTAFAQSSGVEKAAGTPANVLAFVLDKLPLWITAVVIFIISLLLAVVVKSTVESRLASKIEEEHQEALIIAGRVSFVMVATIGITIALSIAGIDLTSILAAIAFGISFGLQDTIANFVAGLALLASRPFTIGDWIKVDGMTGKVEEIRTRATYLKTYNGERLIVPNSSLYKGKVLSFTSNPMRRMRVPVYCRYGANMKDVVAICMNVIKSSTKIFLEPKPNVVFTDFADYYMAMEVRFWVDSKGMWRRIASSVFMQIQKQLEEAGLDAPYPVNGLSSDAFDETAAFQTRNLDAGEFTKLMNARMEEAEKMEKRRAELVKIQQMMQQPDTVDTAGSSFLKVAAFPLGTAANGAPSGAVQPGAGAQNTPQAQISEQPNPIPVEPVNNPKT